MKTDAQQMGTWYLFENFIVGQYGWIGNGGCYNIKLDKGYTLLGCIDRIKNVCLYPNISAE